MKLLVFPICQLLWILCLQHDGFLVTVKANVTERGISKSCNHTDGCLGENVICKEQKCKCDNNYYDDNVGCSLKRGIFEFCNHTDGCFGENVECIDKNCTCSNSSYYDNDGCNSKSGILKFCNHTDGCLGANVECKQHKCTCHSNSYYNNVGCSPKNGIFESCNHTDGCLGENVECIEENCTCSSKYYYDTDECYLKNGIFESCNHTDGCFGENVECIEENCTCSSKYYYDTDGCYLKRGISKSCNHTDGCLGENVICKEQKCKCDNNYYDDNVGCSLKRGIFEFCNHTDGCFGENVECIDKNCTCSNSSYYDNDGCNSKSGILKFCNHTDGCLGANVECKQHKCTCHSNSYYNNVGCSPKSKIFEHCDHENGCIGEYVQCKKNNCTCRSNSYYDTDGCSLQHDAGSECHSNKMCVMGSECKSKKCVCNPAHYNVNNHCFLRNGHDKNCDAPNSCIGEYIVCTRGKCQCKDGYVYNDDDAVCNKSPTTAIIIIIVLIIVISIALLYLLWKIKKKNSADFKPSNKIQQPVELDIRRSRPILMSKFPETVDLMHKDSNKIFNENFLHLGQINPLILTENSDLRSQTVTYLPCHEATKSFNTSKNRFLDILPFDHSRVKLKPIDDDGASDYINANYIPGYSREKEYIAAQGPLSNTSNDFWRMVWQEKVSIIVMLTLCREKEMTKCDNYWPLEKDSKLLFDDITVETTNVTNCESYDYRSMLINIDETTRSLKHFHFLQWADFSANVPVEILLNFVRNVRSHITSTAPVIIHCSAGVGRTGTFIAVDYMLQFVDENALDAKIDIFQFVSKMRDNRVHMVQNKNQYVLIHDCIKHVVKKKMGLEDEESDYQNIHENQGFVTIDLTDKDPDDQSFSLESVQMDIEEVAEDEENEEEEEKGGEEEEAEEAEEAEGDLEENPYENTLPGLPNAEKDCFDDSDENPYDIPKNAMLIKKDEVKELDDSKKHPSAEQKPGLLNAEKDCFDDSDENPYDIPENAMLIKKDEVKELDDSKKHPSAEQKPVIFEEEEENPYENQGFADVDEKQMLTHL